MLGKRKKPGLATAGNEPETSTKEDDIIRPVRRKSRSQRPRNQLVSDDVKSDREPVKAKKAIPPTVGRDAKTGQFTRKLILSGEGTQSCSESKNTGKTSSRLAREKPSRKRRGVYESTIEERLRPVPTRLEELEKAPAAQSMASAVEWLEDIDLIRGKSSYQGVLSRRIKEKVNALKRTLEVLALRVEDKGDIKYLKRRNTELQAQLTASEKEVARMNGRIDELQRTIEELRKLIFTDGTAVKVNKATSPLEVIDKELLARKKETVMRLPIKGVYSHT